MNKLLITGGAGFIGANFVRYWLKHHPDDFVIVLDKLTYAGHLSNLEGMDQYKNFIFIKGEINDYGLVSDIFYKYQINKIINFAAESHVDRSIDNPNIFIETNVMGTLHLLNAAKHFWIETTKSNDHRFHHISTDEVFGSLGLKDLPFSETHSYRPNSPYSASKASADHLVRAYHHTYGLNTTISHCSNNYGPYHLPEKFIPLSLLRIFRGENIPVYGDGKQIRDWLHVFDHCRGIQTILEKGRPGENYNIGGYDGEITNVELIHQICELVDEIFISHPNYIKKYPFSAPAQKKRSASLIKHVIDRPGHDRRYAIDSQKIQKELGFTFETPLSKGLEQTIYWYLENDAWWKTVLKEADLTIEHREVKDPLYT